MVSPEESQKKKTESIISRNAKTYCENTALHGFAYWVGAPRDLDAIQLMFDLFAFNLTKKCA